MNSYDKTLVINACKSPVCPHCKKEKEKGSPFCKDCISKLPKDIEYDLTEPDNYTQVAAYADAAIYLMHDWRE